MGSTIKPSLPNFIIGLAMLVLGLVLIIGPFFDGSFEPLVLIVGTIPLFFGYRQCANIIKQKPEYIYGKSPRPHMWEVFIGGWIANFVFMAWKKNAQPELIWPVATLVVITILFFYLIVTMRRLNDMGMSRWITLLWLIPIVNLVLLLVLLFRGSSVAVKRNELGYDD